MSYVPESLRRLVIARANNCCEYGLIHQDDSLYPHEVDHIIPTKHRGQTDANNLCLSCFDCNRYKGSDFASFDPESDEIALLYNPRQDQWTDHFRHEGARILPLTSVGRVTVFVLKLNDIRRIRVRAAFIAVGRYPRDKS